MTKATKWRWLMAVSSLLCVVIVLLGPQGLEGTEFSGGSLTGRLLWMADVGVALFAMTLVAAFVFPRFAAVLGIVSSALCLPLCVYLVAPSLFSRIGRGHGFSVPEESVHLFGWPIAGIIAVAITAYISVKSWNAFSQR